MIIEAIAGILFTVIGGLVTLLPFGAVTIPSFGPLVGLVRQLDTVLPVTEALAAMLGLYGLAATVYGFRLFMQVKRHIPLIGGG